MTAIIYDNKVDLIADNDLIYQQIITDFPVKACASCNYAQDFPYNQTTSQWALKMSKHWETQIINAIGLTKYNTKVELDVNDPNWFPQKTTN